MIAHTRSGEVIGMCAGPMTRNDTAFMGFYAVDPEFQGIGIGRELWAKTMERLKAPLNAGLYGVPAMSEKYKKAGFGVEDSISMLIYESVPGEALILDELTNVEDLHTQIRLELIDNSTSELLFKRLVEYDCSVQGFSREQLLKNYLRGKDVPLTFALIRATSAKTSTSSDDFRSSPTFQQQQQNKGERKSSCCAKPSQLTIAEDGDESLSSGIKGSLSISSSSVGDLPTKVSSPIEVTLISSSNSPQRQSDLLNEDGDEDFEVIGYGCVRADNKGGGMIGPVYADYDLACEALLKRLLSRFDLKPGAILTSMPLSSNEQASRILEKIGLVYRDRCSRMFTRFIPEAELPNKIYYVHSPNFTLF